MALQSGRRGHHGRGLAAGHEQHHRLGRQRHQLARGLLRGRILGGQRGRTHHLQPLRGQRIAVGEEGSGIRGLALSNAVYLSSWLDQEITLPLDEALFASELEKRAAAERATRA